MAVLFCTNDGNDMGMAEDTNVLTFDSNYVSNSIVIPPTPNGTASAAPITWTESATADTWLHWEAYFNDPNDDNGILDGHLWTLTDGGANIILRGDIFNDEFNWDMNNTTPLMVSSDIPIGITIHDVHINYMAGGIFDITVYINGAQVGTGTFTNGVYGKPRTFDFGGSDAWANNQRVSQILVQETSTIGRKIGVLRPASAGASGQWVGGFAELSDKDNGTVTSTGVVGNRVSSVLTTWTGPTTGNIEKLVLRMNASEQGGGANSINQYVRFGGTNYDGANIVLDESVTPYYEEYLQNPNTAAPWLFADLANTEIGLLAGA